MDNIKDDMCRRILIIDDNEKIHRDFYAILKGPMENFVDLEEEKKAIFGETDSPSSLGEIKNFEVDSAFQGEEGLEKIRRADQEGRPYAMAFVDIRMPPGWDGLETIRRIWQEYPELLVVICTAYSDYSWCQIVKEVKDSEKLLILKKPFDCVEVYQMASSLTEKWHLARQARHKQTELKRLMDGKIGLLQKTNKDLLGALKEAEDAEKAKREFLANASHEVRTPMNTVIGFAEILFEEELTQTQRDYVEQIYQSSKNLLLIINDILDISKIEAGKLEVETAECNLERFLQGIDLMLRLTAQKKGLDFKILQRDNLPDSVYTDQGRLRQCLVNLVGNAIKFTENGHVYVTVSLEENIENQPQLRFDVEDTGIGVAPEKQKAVFEPFKQADSDATHKYGGSGLGLAITKQLTELLGGTISLASEMGKGSVFTLRIPAMVGCCSGSI